MACLTNGADTELAAFHHTVVNMESESPCNSVFCLDVHSSTERVRKNNRDGTETDTENCITLKRVYYSQSKKDRMHLPQGFREISSVTSKCKQNTLSIGENGDTSNQAVQFGMPEKFPYPRLKQTSIDPFHRRKRKSMEVFNINQQTNISYNAVDEQPNCGLSDAEKVDYFNKETDYSNIYDDESTTFLDRSWGNSKFASQQVVGEGTSTLSPSDSRTYSSRIDGGINSEYICGYSEDTDNGLLVGTIEKVPSEVWNGNICRATTAASLSETPQPKYFINQNGIVFPKHATRLLIQHSKTNFFKDHTNTRMTTSKRTGYDKSRTPQYTIEYNAHTTPIVGRSPDGCPTETIRGTDRARDNLVTPVNDHHRNKINSFLLWKPSQGCPIFDRNQVCIYKDFSLGNGENIPRVDKMVSQTNHLAFGETRLYNRAMVKTTRQTASISPGELQPDEVFAQRDQGHAVYKNMQEEECPLDVPNLSLENGSFYQRGTYPTSWQTSVDATNQPVIFQRLGGFAGSGTSQNNHHLIRETEENVSFLGLSKKLKSSSCGFPGCTRSFNKQTKLTDHQRIHTGERPFVCPWKTCGKAFRRGSERKRHFRWHTGEKPYQCPYCARCFSRSDHRNEHVRKIHALVIETIR